MEKNNISNKIDYHNNTIIIVLIIVINRNRHNNSTNNNIYILIILILITIIIINKYIKVKIQYYLLRDITQSQLDTSSQHSSKLLCSKQEVWSSNPACTKLRSVAPSGGISMTHQSPRSAF